MLKLLNEKEDDELLRFLIAMLQILVISIENHVTGFS
jgi:hypothetical protein